MRRQSGGRLFEKAHAPIKMLRACDRFNLKRLCAQDGLHILTLRARLSASFLASAARLAALLLALVNLPACSSMTLPKEETPISGPQSSYGTLVSNHLKATFKTLTPTTAVEVSAPRWVHTLLGWNWLVCTHFQDQGHRRTYVLFFKDNAVVVSRYSVMTDACGTQDYMSLDLSSGAIRPLVSGAQGPLY
jgi:hypothetical protein